MDTQYLRVQKTARYYTLGTAATSHTLLIACHGYGQSAAQFAKKFETLAKQGYFVVVPEGLSRFYWKGTSGDVGASWMTKEDRLHEIEDFCAYLDKLYTQYTTASPEARVVLLGFSQGGTTLARWMHHCQPTFSHFILWGTVLATDLEYRPLSEYLADKQLLHWIGTTDEYVTSARLEAYHAFLDAQKLETTIHRFEGGHRMPKVLLEEVLQNL